MSLQRRFDYLYTIFARKICIHQQNRFFLGPRAGHDGFLCNLVGAWVSLVGAIVGMTASLLATWAAVGVCLGCLAGIFLALADGGVLLSSPLAVSFLFAVAIGSSLAISWFKASVHCGFPLGIRHRMRGSI